ncbi:hypothetical protein D3C84_847530 [compost metagenome]
MVSAIRVRLLTENPARYITPNVPINDNGTATDGMIVALARRKNRNVTMTTRAMAISNSCCTSLTEARMVWVRSVSTTTSRPAGRLSVMLGNRALIRSTTSMTLAPG